MKIVIATDSFKGSISSKEAGETIARGIIKSISACDTEVVPIADGGEGTLDAIVSSENIREARVTGPDWNYITARWGSIKDTAVIEMASAAGITLLPEERLNAGAMTTYGVGELIKKALDEGFDKIMLTAGGSATNDGGCGMIAALGAEFYDADGKKFIPTGKTLINISAIDVSGLDERVKKCSFIAATDVRNTLLGENGATMVFARQKGADNEQLQEMERGMAHYARLLPGKPEKVPASGAGGGVIVPLLAYANTKICSGIDAVLDAADFDRKIEGADAVITGEGKLDMQSLFGKAISGVAERAVKKGVLVYCFAGCTDGIIKKEDFKGIGGIYVTSEGMESVQYSIEHPKEGLLNAAKRFTDDILGMK